MAYVSTKWLVQSSSSPLESFSVRPMSWVLLHSTQPQASVHDITFFRQEHLPPTQRHLRQLQLMNCKSAFGAGCWSIQWMDMWPSITSQPWPCGLGVWAAASRELCRMQAWQFARAIWYLRASLVGAKLQVCAFLLQNSLYRTMSVSSRCFRKVSIRTEHILVAVRRRERTNYQTSSWQRTCLGRTRP